MTTGRNSVSPSDAGTSSPKANGGEGVVWVRRTPTLFEHLLCARLFIYVLFFNFQGTIISIEGGKIEAKTFKLDNSPKVKWLGSGRDWVQI